MKYPLVRVTRSRAGETDSSSRSSDMDVVELSSSVPGSFVKRFSGDKSADVEVELVVGAVELCSIAAHFCHLRPCRWIQSEEPPPYVVWSESSRRSTASCYCLYSTIVPQVTAFNRHHHDFAVPVVVLSACSNVTGARLDVAQSVFCVAALLSIRYLPCQL